MPNLPPPHTQNVLLIPAENNINPFWEAAKKAPTLVATKALPPPPPRA